jgi:predicted 3-demethylubiquinone-9 3-methyltransferase (glyoxalase superfamily)
LYFDIRNSLGQAEEAISFYASIFPDSKVVEITRYKANKTGAEGSVCLRTLI